MDAVHANSFSGQAKVVIIGAGAAGIGAAQHLFNNGVKDVVILEATNGIGGRIQTVSFGSNAENIVELGANWIHGGTIANPFFTAAIEGDFTEKDGRVPILDRFKNCSFGKCDGKLVDLELGQRAIDAFFEVERAAFNLYFQNHIATKQNLAEFMKAELKLILHRQFSDIERDDVQCAFNAMWNYLKFHVSDDLEKHSAKYYGTFQEIPGNDVIVPGGFSKLLAKFTDEFPPDVIRYNRQVSRIDWNPNGHSQVTITCQDGSKWRSDHVIVTVSLGYLKQHVDNMFNPRVPSWKKDAIDRIGFGSTNKIFLEFSKPFWKSGMMGSIAFAWSDEELKERENGSWEKSIYGFDEVYNNPNVLVGWISGWASKIMEKSTDQDVIDTCIKLLRRFTGNPNIPAPKRIWRTTWCADPWALGSYSYPTVQSGPKEIQDLALPLPCEQNPTVMFAGEATNDNYFSTIHGALLSGIKEAQRIILLPTISKL